jgi:hypothetical protein
MLRCLCCGRWTVEPILLDRGHGPRRRLKVCSEGYIVGYYARPDAVEAVLREAGVLAHLADETGRRLRLVR